MNKIPLIGAPAVYNESAFSDSKFVKLTDCSAFDIKLQYPLMKLRNSVAECYVREELSDRLLAAADLLPKGIRLRIFDTWRPLALQIELYEYYSKSIIRKFGLENEEKEKREEIISRYVSYPENNVLLPPVHTTGGAVDLTLIDSDGNELDMGTEFDSFSEAASTAYYEQSGADTKIRDNRRMLYKAMTGAGFTNLPSEWWHYDFGDRFWAYYNRKPAIYNGVFTAGGIRL